MELVKAKEKDVPRSMELIEQARAFLRENGVDQWQDGYPDEAVIRADAAAGRGYLCMEDGRSVGYLCADFDGEPAYGGIEGRWLSEQPYVVVHRLALDNAVKGRGLASQVFRLVEELALGRGVHSFKIDTQTDNKRMRHLLEKNGFQYCGTILFDGDKKLAYEKLI